MDIDEREKLYEEIFKRLSEYRFTGYSDEVVLKEAKNEKWGIEVYNYPAYPEEELTDEDCYQGTIYIEEDGIYWDGEIIKDIDELFKKIIV